MKNKVELLGYYGSDLTHAQSAWTSTVRELDEDKLKRVDKLLEGLAKNGHHTPFEKSSLHFLITVDDATHIQSLKHRIGVSINGESARYKQLLETKYYIPEDWKGIKVKHSVGFIYNSINNISCNIRFKPEETEWSRVLEWYTNLGNALYEFSLLDLTETLGRKRAKESARFFKPKNSQLTFDIMFNWRSFYHFQKLRNDEHAQLEIREVAQKMLNLVKNIEGNPFEKTIKAFQI